MQDFATARERMIERQVRDRGLDDPRLIAALRAVPREEFVDPGLVEHAYSDQPLPIESGQTISQPYIVALMIDAARIGPNDRVLEIGAGSGYAAAVIGHIARQVVAIERHRELAELARERIERLGYANVRIVEGDGTLGWPEQAPYDAILAAASGPGVSPAWVEQLSPGGRIVMPIGEPGAVQSLMRFELREDGSLDQADLGPVRFVPLVGEHGWKEGQG